MNMLKRIIDLHQSNIHQKKIKCSMSTLESISNELFMELFEYFDLYSLYFTFYSLNSRLNSIICHSQVHVNLNLVNPLYFTSFIGQFILSNIDNGRILSLQSSIPHQIAVLANDMVMDRFTSLRSLILTRCSSDLVIQILDRIDKSLLGKISISSCKRTIGMRISLIQHLLSAERYPSLRSINLRLCGYGISYLTDIESKQTLNRLEYLSLDKMMDVEYLFNIIRLSPNLQSLTSVLNNSDNSILKLPLLTKSLVLYRFKLTSSSIQISTLEYLLDNFPNLSYLYLDFSTKSSKLIDSQYWIDLFEKMPKLKRVYIRMVIRLSETTLSYNQVRERIKLNERPWFFIRTLLNRMSTIRIIINDKKIK